MNFNHCDRIRLHFLSLEIQRISFELSAQRILGRQRPVARLNGRMGCLLCGEVMRAEVLFTSGTCGHIFCNDCYNGITRRGLNTFCAYDRLDLALVGKSFKLNGAFNGLDRIICAACETPFDANDSGEGVDSGIYALTACGHIFHSKCMISNIYQCVFCAAAITHQAVRLFASFN